MGGTAGSHTFELGCDSTRANRAPDPAGQLIDVRPPTGSSYELAHGHV